MYGTVAILRVKPGKGDELARLSSSYDEIDVPGFIASYVYRLDRDPKTYVMAVLFQDHESYHRNAADPEQDRRYREMRELLESDPEWNDGEVVHASGKGGA